jgi:hypothetical protein
MEQLPVETVFEQVLEILEGVFGRKAAEHPQIGRASPDAGARPATVSAPPGVTAPQP